MHFVISFDPKYYFLNVYVSQPLKKKTVRGRKQNKNPSNSVRFVDLRISPLTSVRGVGGGGLTWYVLPAKKNRNNLNI